MAMNIKIMVFWGVPLCNLINGYLPQYYITVYCNLGFEESEQVFVIKWKLFLCDSVLSNTLIS
jgi:hypothetical protein